MFPFCMFLCASILFVASFAYIPSENAKFHIFDSELHPFETSLTQSINDLETTSKNEGDVDAALKTTEDALDYIVNMVDGDWKKTFYKATNDADTAVKCVTEVGVQIKDLRNELSAFKLNKESRKSNGPKIAEKLEKILQKFNGEDSAFRSYPLISSPLLIELALVVPHLISITKGLQIEQEMKKYRLPCLAYDLLFEYREYAVDYRLDKLQTVMHRDDEKHKVDLEDLKDIATQTMEFTIFAKKYDPSIALSERADIIAGTYKKGEFTDEYKLHDCLNPTRYISTFKTMVDDFGADKEKEWDFRTCAGEYALIVKERTEKMYPVSFFKDICDETRGNPTGEGYLTIKIKRIQAHQPYDDEDCDGHFFSYNGIYSSTIRCDPYVELYVGGEKVWTSKSVDNTALIEPNYTYRSKNPIKKDSEVVIKVMDANRGEPTLVQSSGGKISDWLDTRNRPGSALGIFRNLIETFVMWKDVYQK